MYVLLVSNYEIDEYTTALFSIGRFRKNSKSVRKQRNFAKTTAFNRFGFKSVKKIPLEENPFYNELFLTKNDFLIDDRYRELMSCLACNILILPSKEEVFRFLFDPDLLFQCIDDSYIIKRIFEIDGEVDFFTPAGTLYSQISNLREELRGRITVGKKLDELYDVTEKYKILTEYHELIDNLSNQQKELETNLRKEIEKISIEHHDNITNKIKNYNIPITCTNKKLNYLDKHFNLTL